MEEEDKSGGSGSQPIAKDQELLQQQAFVAINRWTTDRVLEWLNKKLLQHHLPGEQCAAAGKAFAAKRITGEILLELNNDYLEYMGIGESRLKEILLEEIALLKIRNEYEFIRRFKSQAETN